jgi:hypothetical protein
MQMDAASPARIVTASWFTALPHRYCRIGISRGRPRIRIGGGYRMMKRLAPGPWFRDVMPEQYERLFRIDVLAGLDPRSTAQELLDLAQGRIPTLLCFETPKPGQWCHRALVARWLSDALGEAVPEYGHEHAERHPLLPA